MRSRALDSWIAGGLLLAVPVALVLGVGIPPLGTRLTLTHLLGVTVVIAWLAWAWCTAGVVVDVVRRVRAGDAHTHGVSGARAGLAAHLAALVLAASSVAPTLAADASTPRTAHAIGTVVANNHDQSVPLTTSLPQPPARPTPSSTWTVASGDCLWTIAERVDGDGEAWTLLAAANLGHVMTDGRLFTDPSLIYPGWVLAIPSQLLPPAPTPETISPGQTDVPVRPLAEVPPTSRPHSHASATAASSQMGSFAADAVMASGALGVGAVSLGLLRRRRRRVDRLGWVDDEAIDLEVLLEQSRLLPALTLTESALLLAAEDGVLNAAGLLSVGMDGARFFVDATSVWHAEPADLVACQSTMGAAPAAIAPLGDLDGTSWTLIAPAGTRATIAGGEQAEQLVSLARTLQPDLAWGHQTRWLDEAGPNEELRALHDGLLLSDDPLCNHPRVAVLAVSEDMPLVRADDAGIALLALGLHIPHRGPARIAPCLLEDPESIPPLGADQPPDPGTNDDGPTMQRGPMVRLLALQPRIDGLTEPIDSKRARRAVEVVAYIVLHDPDPVTGDRIRTRVLGSASRDAAAKTLFNVTSAARRALGLTPEGDAVLPIADRTGCYRAGSLLTSDVAELHAHVACARRSNDPEAQMAHLRAGLELIEGEPLGATLAAWDWFTLEGHQARLEATIEGAAVWLVELALGANLVDLAQLALDRARLAVPLSEPLAAAAMEVAAKRGSLIELQRCFADLGTIVDEIDPGCWPTPEHEARFGVLSEEVRGGAAQASLAAMVAAPRSTRPSAPAAL